MRIVCYTCPHGLDPGPYDGWGAEHQTEHRWLLDVTVGALGATHIVLPTEAFARRDNGYTPEKLAWLALEARERGLTPVVWLDKWMYAYGDREIARWLELAQAATAAAEPCWLLVSEGDLLWQLHPMSSRTVLRGLAVAKGELLERGVGAERLWAGGATVEGTLAIDRMVCPAVLTWTAWRAIQRGLAAEGQQTVYREVLADVGAIQRGRLHAGTLAVVELGWSVANGGPLVQAQVVEQAAAAARDLGVPPGLWSVVDWPHDVRNGPVEAGYGVLDANGGPRPALAAWRQQAGA